MKTFLAQNEFIPNSVGHSAPAPTESAVASKPPPAAAATAAPFSVSFVSVDLISEHANAAVASKPNPAADATAVPFAEPSMTMEVPSEASAPAPTKNPDADALDCIHEIFFYARKLMKQPPRFVLDEAAFMAEVEEEPLFLRDGEHLRRWSA